MAGNFTSCLCYGRRNEASRWTFALKSGGAGHWGADQVMQQQIFREPKPDPLGRRAGNRDGALAALVGIAARHSIEQKRPLKIDELVKI